MKKLLPLLVVGVLFISGVGTVALPDEKIKHEKITLSFSQLSIHEKGDYVSLELEGTNSVLMKKDHYMVPACIETFTFTFGTEIKSVKVIPKNIHQQTLTKELMVAPEPVLMGQPALNEKVQRNINPIVINTWYEYDVGIGINGNERNVFVKVQVYPVQYYPSENTIEWAENIEIDIKYKEPEQPIVFGDEYALIVLTPVEYSDELEDLIVHKNSRGISTKLVTLDEIYDGNYFPVEGRDNQEKIKYFIKNAIESWGTSFVLLVGGSQKFPTRISHINLNDWDHGKFVSDLYYADIYNETGDFASWDTNENDVFAELDVPGSDDDEVDLYPDVHLGRLACVNANEVTTCVNKIITYETNRAYTRGWFTNLVSVGGDTHIGDAEAIDEGEYVNDVIIDIMDGFIPDRLYASSGRLSGYFPTGSAEITSAINEGCGFINFIGHGATWGYGTHPHEDPDTWLPTPDNYYFNTDVLSLANGGGLPIVFTSGCDVGKFYEDDDCFSWAFISNPDGGGIASCGASAVSYGGGGTGSTQVRVGKMIINMFKAYKQQGAKTFGEMWKNAITNYIYPSMSSIDYKVVESWQSFGDPTLAIGEESQPPEKPETPDGPTSGKINVEHTYTTSTTDPDGDQIYYLFDWGDDEFSGWVGPYDSGENAEATHAWGEKGDYRIRVKAKDEHGVQSEWSDPLPISMPKSYSLKSLFEEIFEWLEQIVGRNIFQ